MSIHKVNIDAIQEGVDAFLESYPHPPAERGPPRGAHAVLWVDDFWRGVDMAGEALEAARLQVSRGPLYPQPSMENLRRTACASIYTTGDADEPGHEEHYDLELHADREEPV